MTPMTIQKYPRTPHLAGSRLQPGDEDMTQAPLDVLRGRYVVIEEKVDGASTGISFDADGKILLQSRGHYLTGGPRERHFGLMKPWAAARAGELREIVPRDGVMYGEWMYAKHTCFYDALPHWFLEFDVKDAEGRFWSTARRRAVLAYKPWLVSVPVLWQGVMKDPRLLSELVVPSLYKSPRWRAALAVAARQARVPVERAEKETDGSDLAEGLYVKVEEDGYVVERYKWIRHSFLAAILQSDSHWHERPIIANGLAPGRQIFG